MKHGGLWLLTAALVGVSEPRVFAGPPQPARAPAKMVSITPASVLRTNLPPLNPRLPNRALGCKPAGQAIARPGVYAAEPYNCLIVVPAAQLDDRCLVGGGAPTVRMPTVKPDVRLRPLQK